VISYVNGKKISTIKDLVSAFENHTGKYHIIEDEWGYKIVLDANRVKQNSRKVLGKYKISFDRSKDLEN
jgi:ABC-type proline/glycine betaine transport system substrate-binding protein